MSRLHLIKFILFSFCVFVFSAPLVLAAQTITIDTKFLTPDTNATSVPEFIARFYELGLGIAGIVAVGMIVVGAIFYTISGASPQKKGEAKDIIFSALWGVVLLFGSYLILRSINPQLIDLRDPGSGLGGDLPSPIETGNCSSTTPIVDTSGNPTSGNIPKCTGAEPAINPTTGFCQCYKEETQELGCPEIYRPTSFSTPYPDYSWANYSVVNPGSVINHTAPASGISPLVCPRKVRIPANTKFYTVDCDNMNGIKYCEQAWSTQNDDWEYDEDTIGWVWPYYNREVGPQNTICVMYAHYDPKDKEIERSDIDGAKPCTYFSSTTPATYGFTNTYGSGPAQTNTPIPNPNQSLRQPAADLIGYITNGKIAVSSYASCRSGSDPNTVLSDTMAGYYPLVCSDGCSPTSGCEFGGVNHATALSSKLLYGLTYAASKTGQNVNGFLIPKFTITSLTGGDHAPNSSHYKGIGADISVSGELSTWSGMAGYLLTLSEVQNAFCEYVDQNGTTKYTCSGIMDAGASNKHIHIDFKQ